MKTKIKATGLCRLNLAHIVTIILVPVMLIIGLSISASADDDEAFTLFKLSVADELLDLQTEDLNADGLKDILIIHRKGLPPKQTRWLSVFWQSADGGFSTAANQSWELDTNAAVLDIGDVAGDQQKEICYLTATGVCYYPLNTDHYETKCQTLLQTRGLTVFPSKRRIPQINFVRDWNGDGDDEVGVFQFGGLTIYSRAADGSFSGENKITVELSTRMSRGGEEDQQDADLTAGLSARFSFPDIRLVDYDGNGRKDIIATTDDRVIVYLQQPDGNFAAQPDKDRLFDVRTQHEKIEDLAQVETRVVDLNNDGYADAIVTKQTSKGLSNFRGVIHIYWGRPEGYPPAPDQVIISEGTASVHMYIRDVNGDGRKDLILPSIKISITAIIRWLITRNIPVYFNIFLLSEDRRFSDRPDFTKEVKFRVDWSGESDNQAMDLEGDYNGDKRRDFVFATDEDELSIYLGIPEGGKRLFSKKPITKVSVDAYGRLSSPDLNNDGYSDMIIYYPQSKDRKGMVQILMNRKRLE